MSRRDSRRMRPRRGARQQGGHTHYVPGVSRHYHELNTSGNRTNTGQVIGGNVDDIIWPAQGGGWTGAYNPWQHGAGVPGNTTIGSPNDGSHPGHTRPGLVKPRGGRRSSQKGKLGGAARISTVRGTPRRRR